MGNQIILEYNLRDSASPNLEKSVAKISKARKQNIEDIKEEISYVKKLEDELSNLEKQRVDLYKQTQKQDEAMKKANLELEKARNAYDEIRYSAGKAQQSIETFNKKLLEEQNILKEIEQLTQKMISEKEANFAKEKRLMESVQKEQEKILELQKKINTATSKFDNARKDESRTKWLNEVDRLEKELQETYKRLNTKEKSVRDTKNTRNSIDYDRQILELGKLRKQQLQQIESLNKKNKTLEKGVLDVMQEEVHAQAEINRLEKESAQRIAEYQKTKSAFRGLDPKEEKVSQQLLFVRQQEAIAQEKYNNLIEQEARNLAMANTKTGQATLRLQELNKEMMLANEIMGKRKQGFLNAQVEIANIDKFKETLVRDMSIVQSAMQKAETEYNKLLAKRRELQRELQDPTSFQNKTLGKLTSNNTAREKNTEKLATVRNLMSETNAKIKALEDARKTDSEQYQKAVSKLTNLQNTFAELKNKRAEINRNIISLMQEVRQMTSIPELDVRMNQAKKELDDVSKQLVQQTKLLNDATAKQQQFQNRAEQSTRGLSSAMSQLNRMEQEAIQIGNILARQTYTALDSGINRVSSGTRRQTVATRQLSEAQQAQKIKQEALRQETEAYRQTAENTGHTVFSLTKLIGIFLRYRLISSGYMLMTQSLEDVINSEDALNKTKVLADLSEKQLARLGDKVTMLSNKYGQLRTEVATAGLELAKMGYTGKDLTNAFAPTMALAKTSGKDPKSVAETVSMALKTYGASSKMFEYYANVIHTAIAGTAIDFDDFDDAFKNSASTAKMYGIQINELSGFIGFLGDRGIKSGMAGVGLKNILVDLLSPTRQVAKVLADIGVTKDMGLFDILMKVRANNTIPQLKEAFNLRSLPLILAITSNEKAMREIAIKMGKPFRDEDGVMQQNELRSVIKDSMEMMTSWKGQLDQLKMGFINTFTELANTLKSDDKMEKNSPIVKLNSYFMQLQKTIKDNKVAIREFLQSMASGLIYIIDKTVLLIKFLYEHRTLVKEILATYLMFKSATILTNTVKSILFASLKFKDASDIFTKAFSGGAWIPKIGAYTTAVTGIVASILAGQEAMNILAASTEKHYENAQRLAADISRPALEKKQEAMYSLKASLANTLHAKNMLDSTVAHAWADNKNGATELVLSPGAKRDIQDWTTNYKDSINKLNTLIKKMSEDGYASILDYVGIKDGLKDKSDSYISGILTNIQGIIKGVNFAKPIDETQLKPVLDNVSKYLDGLYFELKKTEKEKPKKDSDESGLSKLMKQLANGSLNADLVGKAQPPMQEEMINDTNRLINNWQNITSALGGFIPMAEEMKETLPKAVEYLADVYKNVPEFNSLNKVPMLSDIVKDTSTDYRKNVPMFQVPDDTTKSVQGKLKMFATQMQKYLETTLSDLELLNTMTQKAYDKPSDVPKTKFESIPGTWVIGKDNTGKPMTVDGQSDQTNDVRNILDARLNQISDYLHQYFHFTAIAGNKVGELQIQKQQTLLPEDLIKLKEFNYQIRDLTKAFDTGKIHAKEYTDGMDKIAEDIKNEIDTKTKEKPKYRQALAYEQDKATAKEAVKPVPHFPLPLRLIYTVIENLKDGKGIDNLISEIILDFGRYGEDIASNFKEGFRKGLDGFDNVMEKITPVLNAYQGLAGNIQGYMDVLVQNEAKNNQEKIKLVDERYDAEIEKAHGNQKKIKKIEAARASEKKKLEEEQQALEKANFERKKIFALADVAINTAVAIQKAWSDSNVIAPVVIPLILASAAVQVATISAQKYAFGGLVRGGGNGTSDSVPAMLSRGEYVVPSGTVDSLGGAGGVERQLGYLGEKSASINISVGNMYGSKEYITQMAKAVNIELSRRGLNG